MKKLIYTLLAVSILFATCKKEDDEPTGNNNNNSSASIVGDWNLTEYDYTWSEGYWTSYPDGEKVITSTETEITTPGIGDTTSGIESVLWNFSSDGFLIVTASVDGEIGIDTLIYEKDGNALIIDSNTVWSIISLTSSNLITNHSSEDTMTYSWDPSNDTVYFNQNDGTAKWSRISIAPDNSNAKLIKGNKDHFFKSFIDRKRK